MDDLAVPALAGAYPLIGQLPAHLQRAISIEGRPLRATAGARMFSEGDVCHSFVLVTSGEIRVAKTAANGREIELYRVLPGDSCILTVSCLLGGAAYPASGVAAGELSGVEIPKALFDRLVTKSPAFRQFIFSFIAERLALLMALIEQVAFQRLDARLAAALLRGRPQVNRTHQALADELGSVREVISRLLKEFESQALIRLDRGVIYVLDAPRLAQISSPSVTQVTDKPDDLCYPIHKVVCGCRSCWLTIYATRQKAIQRHFQNGGCFMKGKGPVSGYRIADKNMRSALRRSLGKLPNLLVLLALALSALAGAVPAHTEGAPPVYQLQFLGPGSPAAINNTGIVVGARLNGNNYVPLVSAERRPLERAARPCRGDERVPHRCERQRRHRGRVL